MVEAKTRKAVFLLEALRHLDIADASVETARFEQLLTRPELHEAFDVLTIRAVRVESATLVTLQAFLKPGGQMFWFQGAGRELEPDLLVFPLVLIACCSAGGSFWQSPRDSEQAKPVSPVVSTMFHVEHSRWRDVWTGHQSALQSPGTILAAACGLTLADYIKRPIT